MTLRHAGLGNDNFDKAGQLGLETVPNPDSQVFACGIFEATDLVQVMMVELFEQGSESFHNIGVIHDPAEMRVAFSFHDDFGAEAVTVKTAAFMVFGHMRQEMGRFKLKRFTELQVHQRPIVITFPNPSMLPGRQG
jgi:hypothetical protein